MPFPSDSELIDFFFFFLALLGIHKRLSEWNSLHYLRLESLEAFLNHSQTKKREAEML